jgi:hypothetical protein
MPHRLKWSPGIEVPLTCAGNIEFGPEVDAAALPAHLADSLRAAKATSVEVNANRVGFSGGMFRPVGNWNVLVPFEWGELVVDPEARQVQYVLSIGQLLVFATGLAGFMGAFLVLATRSWSLVVFPVFIWLWLVGGNLAIGLPRFRSFIRQAITTTSIS